MDKSDHFVHISVGPDQTRTDFERSLSLPPIENTTLPPSLQQLAEKKKRTIETEFGTIIIDAKGLKVQSDSSDASTDTRRSSLPTPQHVFPATAAGTESRNASDRHASLPTAPSSSLAQATATEQDRRMERGMWISNAELLLVSMSSFVGFNSMIGIPRVWLEFGGGTFLVAYTTCQLVITLPLYLLEAALGQFAAHGMSALMPEMVPALKGYSYALLFSLVVTTVGWMSDISTVAIYAVDSTKNLPPWMSCNSSYNSERCYTNALDSDCQTGGKLLFAAGRCVRREEVCASSGNASAVPPPLGDLAAGCILLGNGSTQLNWTALRAARELAAAEYFYNVKRNEEPGGKHKHALHGQRLFSLLACWLLVTLVSQAGLDGVGYTLPLLLGLPMCIMIGVTVNMLVLYGSFGAIWRQFIPELDKLGNPKCWLAAATSSLFCVNIGLGINSVIYSRNPLMHNCQRSATAIIACKFTMTSLWVMCCSFILGNHAMTLNKDVSQLLIEYKDKQNLIILTSSLGTLDKSKGWSALLLLAVLLLSIGCVQAAVLVIEVSLRELSLIDSLSIRSAICLICSVAFVIDVLLSVFPSSYYATLAIEAYAATYYNIVLTLALIAAVNAVLGVNRLLDALSQHMAMSLRWSRWFWAACWRFICPVTMLALFVSTIWNQASRPLQHRGTRLPAWTAVLGVTLIAGPLLLLFGVLFRVYGDRENDEQKLYTPTQRWRPGLLPPAPNVTASTLAAGGTASHPRVAPSLMTKMYAIMSSRQLLGKTSLVDVAVTDAPKEDAVAG